MWRDSFTYRILKHVLSIDCCVFDRKTSCYRWCWWFSNLVLFILMFILFHDAMIFCFIEGWLAANGYNANIQRFVDEMIDGETLLTLSATDLTGLGMKKLGERNKMLGRIAKLKAANKASARAESSSSMSEEGGDRVKIIATLKKRTVTIEVAQVIQLNSILYSY